MNLSNQDLNELIAMAWADDVTFDDIELRFGLNEDAVMKIMKSSLRFRSYKLWRTRVHHIKKVKNYNSTKNLDKY